MEKLKKKKLSNKWLLAFLALFMFVGSLLISYKVAYSSDVSGGPLIVDNNYRFNLEESEKTNSWEYNNQEISGTVNVKETTTSSGCSSSTTYTAQTSKLTITSNNNENLYLKFKCEVQGNGSAMLGNDTISNDDEKKILFKLNTSITISITSGDTEGASITLILSDFEVNKITNVNLTCLVATNGTYFVDNTQIVSETSFSKLGDEGFEVNAVPDEGYTFYAWNINGTKDTTKSPQTTLYFNENTIIYPIFISNEYATFKNNNKTFLNLNDAINNANSNSDKIIVLEQSGSLFQNETYILNSGLTLYIPNSNTVKIYDDDSFIENVNRVTPSVFKFLNINNNSKLIVESGATLYVAATASSRSYGAVSGSYGKITVSDNSAITLKSNSKLYCYGYIDGDGVVESENGSEIHELFQFTSWFGADESITIINDKDSKVFAVNQYYVQNIECYFKLYYGAQLIVHTGVSVVRNLFHAETSMNFIGNEGIFILEDSGSYLIRKYNSENDTIIYDIYGNVKIAPITLSMNVPIVGDLTIASEDYVLPINNNFVINVHEDSKVIITQDLCLLPGCKLNVMYGGEVNFYPNVSLYVYDTDVRYGKKYTSKGNIGVILYSSTLGAQPTRTFTSNSLDAEIDINGKLITNSGASVYTTLSYNEDETLKGAANIHSSNGTGQIEFVNSIGTNTLTYQYTNRNSSMEVEGITVAPAYLKNGDESYFIPSEHDVVNKIIFFDKTLGLNGEWTIGDSSEVKNIITFKDPVSLKTYQTEYIVGKEFTFPTEEDLGFKYNGYKIKFWQIGNSIFRPNEVVIMDNLGDVEAIAIWGGWIKENNKWRYLEYSSESTEKYLTGLNKLKSYNANDKNLYIFLFDEAGYFQNDFSGIFNDSEDEKKYYVLSGIVQENLGLTAYFSTETSSSYEYIFIQSDNSLLTSGRYYINTNLNSLLPLPSGYYEFDANGYIKRDDLDTTNYYNGQLYIKDYVTYIDGIKVSWGLFTYQDYYYYSNINCEIVRNTTFYVSKTNNLGISEGLYYFDEQGRMYDQNFDLIEVNQYETK